MQSIICAIAKNENAYLYEWATYHLALGFSHIYLYDNNDVDGEQITDVLNADEFIGKITIIDVRGQKYIQKRVYNDCYRTRAFDWCAFIDIDEFIVLEKNKNISEFLRNFTYHDAIYLNWKCYGDSGHVSYKAVDVTKRFTKPWRSNVYYGYIDRAENTHIKSIIKSGFDINWEYNGDDWSSNPHTPYGLKNICNAQLDQLSVGPFAPICHNVAYIRHYTTKTIEEYAVKVSRQCADCDAMFYSFPKFFRVNKLSFRKLWWLRANYPTVSTWACIKEHVRYSILNYHLPLRFLFRSLKKCPN